MVFCPAHRATFVTVALTLVTVGLAGCIGGEGDLDTPDIPEAIMKITKVEGTEDTFFFDATDSTGDGLVYLWDFGDRTFSDDASLEYTYETGSGVYTVILIVTDKHGVEDIERQEVVVGTGENFAPKADFEPQFRYYGVGEPVLVDATATKDPDGDDVIFFWDFNWFMDEQQYLSFRDKKQKAASSGSDDGGAEVAAGAGFDPIEDLSAWLTSGGTHGDSPGHGGDGGIGSSSLKEIQRDTENPIFTLKEGLPEEGFYFIRLVAMDIKGASDAVYSEQIWPVRVVAQKELQFRTEEHTGTFQAGATSSVQEETPTQDGTYADEAQVQWTLDRFIKRMWVNVTWDPAEAAAVEQGKGFTQNDIDIELQFPDQTKTPRVVREPDDSGGTKISLEILGADEPGEGTYVLDLFGRNGVDFDWRVDWWAEVDLDDFKALEAPYRQ